MAQTPNTLQQSAGPEAKASPSLTVHQPEKLENLLDTIGLLSSITERMSEDRSGDMGGSGAAKGKGSTTASTAGGVSWRDEAIAHLPVPAVMQQKLQEHILLEIKQLRKQVQTTALRISRPGSAYKINQLYAKIRRLSGLLQDLLSASAEVLKRFYIRTFIDKQSVSS